LEIGTARVDLLEDKVAVIVVRTEREGGSTREMGRDMSVVNRSIDTIFKGTLEDGNQECYDDICKNCNLGNIVC